MPDHILERIRAPFIAGTAVGWDADGRDAAGVNDSPHTRALRGTQDIARAFNIGAIQLRGIARAQSIVGRNVEQCFAALRRALERAWVGKIAFGGREHLVAISATNDDKLGGMMAYIMRYAEELRDPADYFSEIKKVTVDQDQLSLAEELIKRKAAKFAPEKFTDEYEAALREMVKAKIEHAPIPQGEPAAKSAKVINLMDALRKSVQGDSAAETRKKAPAKSVAGAKKGIVLVKPGPQPETGRAAAKSTRSPRKSA